MMYTFGIYIYILLVRLAALFGYGKARLKIEGNRDAMGVLKENVKSGERYVWFHVSSRGGFEQARPMIERLRSEHPEYRIVLTFFSPTGYGVARNYQSADIVCYLPFDTPRNARSFLDVLKPEMAFFVKFEFWLNFLSALQKRSVPVYSVSSCFRKGQRLFGVFGGRLRLALHCFTHLYVQDDESKSLLMSVGVRNVTVVGNTRFDRVVKILEQSRQIPLLEAFCNGCKVFVAGASERGDEAVYIPYFNRNRAWKLIVVPNKAGDEHIKAIEKQYEGACVRYTRANMDNISKADCVIVDCYGLLSSVYKYGDIAFVGGGFGNGVHNVLEAAVFGVPVLVGPANRTSRDMNCLIGCGGAVVASNAYDFGEKVDMLTSDADLSSRIGDAAGRYVLSNAGATARIFERLGI